MLILFPVLSVQELDGIMKELPKRDKEFTLKEDFLVLSLVSSPIQKKNLIDDKKQTKAIK
jgi:hypothetical protein